jgi:hypothetical protein
MKNYIVQVTVENNTNTWHINSTDDVEQLFDFLSRTTQAAISVVSVKEQ